MFEDIQYFSEACQVENMKNFPRTKAKFEDTKKGLFQYGKHITKPSTIEDECKMDEFVQSNLRRSAPDRLKSEKRSAIRKKAASGTTASSAAKDVRKPVLGWVQAEYERLRDRLEKGGDGCGAESAARPAQPAPPPSPPPRHRPEPAFPAPITEHSPPTTPAPLLNRPSDSRATRQRLVGDDFRTHSLSNRPPPSTHTTWLLLSLSLERAS